jgi:hypothetical protein
MKQIPYFEFLITSEFNLGTAEPRLPLWDTHVVNSYIALDSLYVSKKEFGRLAVRYLFSILFYYSYVDQNPVRHLIICGLHVSYIFAEETHFVNSFQEN